ncbi:MAG: hypothetical protein VYA30_15735 [Myxococcota bacterium]|nr:hypothetical protein [Myxococcota bacterium]
MSLGIRHINAVIIVVVLGPSTLWAESRNLVSVNASRRIAVKSWGPHCGAKPKSRGLAKGRTYSLKNGRIKSSKGGQVLFGSGVCRSATGLPNLSESGGKPGRMSCKSASSSSTSVLGRITRKTKGETITITHRLEYEWRLNESHCHTIDRLKWTLRAQGLNDKPKNKKQEKKDLCASPGPPKSLLAKTPRRSKAAVGEILNFKVVVLDKNRCPLSIPVKWSTQRGRITRKGQLDTTGLTEGQFRVTARVKSLRTRFRVQLTPERTADPLTPAHAPLRANATLQDSEKSPRYNGILLIEAVQNKSKTSGHWLIIGSLSVVVGLICIALGYRRRAS